MKRGGKEIAIAVCLTMAVGCGAKQDSAHPKAPRPVSVIVLAETNPSSSQRVTGTVASWKTDQIGFEVDGRVEFVIEPETNITGQVYDEDGNLITEGTLLARLDATRGRGSEHRVFLVFSAKVHARVYDSDSRNSSSRTNTASRTSSIINS